MPDDAPETTPDSSSTQPQADPVTPGQDPEDAVAPVPAPGDSDASVSSPGAWTALAAPGKPDGEVDTRP